MKNDHDTKAYEVVFSKENTQNYEVKTRIQHVRTFGVLDMSFWKKH